MSQNIRSYLSESMRRYLDNILSVMKKYDAEKVFVYGSVARGDYTEKSDLDICAEGLDNHCFLMALGECIMTSEHSVSVTDMSHARGYFRERILREGKADLKHEVAFGLENLNKVYEHIRHISESDAEAILKVPALTYTQHRHNPRVSVIPNGREESQDFSLRSE